VINSAKLTLMLAIALVFGQLQCAAWCTINTCGLSELNHSSSENMPPCHRHHSDSDKHSPDGPCSHGVVVAAVVDSSAIQTQMPVLVVATLAVEPEANSRTLILGNAFAALTSAPRGSDGRYSPVLRI
jgi:hypothetical protein